MAIRGLGRSGIRVVGIDSDSRLPGFRSRYCTAKLAPDPLGEPEALVAFLREEGRTLKDKGILFPATDAYVLFVSRHGVQLSEYFEFALPPARLVEAILNKRTQYELAEQAGIPIPQTFYPTSASDLPSIQDRIIYPAVVKSCYAHVWKDHFGGKAIRIDSPKQLRETFEKVRPTGMQVIVQSVIPGPCTNNLEVSFYVSRLGELLGHVTVRKLRQYPPDFGVGTMVTSIRSPELMALRSKLLDETEYRGFGNLEFKLDPRDGILKLIELNARLWQQNDQTERRGLNFPLVQYLDLTGQSPGRQPEVAEGIKWVDPLADFQSFWHSFRQGELGPADWLRSWKGVKAFSVFAADDLLPALASLDYGLKVLRLPLYLIRNRAAQVTR